MAPTTPPPGSFQLPLIYRIFFLFFEPACAILGAYGAHVQSELYLSMMHPASASSPLPTGTTMAMSQLANMYLFFGLNEAFVLRSTADLRIWRTVIGGMLVADLGHLYSCLPLGTHIYYSGWGTNFMNWGNIPFVYLGAAIRIAFLLGIGLGGKKAVAGGSTKKTG